jgi:hypothetical protein
MLACRGYDVDWFCDALREKGITAIFRLGSATTNLAIASRFCSAASNIGVGATLRQVPQALVSVIALAATVSINEFGSGRRLIIKKV